MQALSHRDFARYAFSRLFATLSWQMIDSLLVWQMWAITGDYLYVGYIGLAQFIPFVLCGVALSHCVGCGRLSQCCWHQICPVIARADD